MKQIGIVAVVVLFGLMLVSSVQADAKLVASPSSALILADGDYDGDGCWDAAIYVQASGQWYIGTLDGRVLAWGIEWGGLGFEPVMGDYDGDGKWDLGVYQEATGLWYIKSLDGRIFGFWPFIGVVPAIGRSETDWDNNG